MNKMCLTICLLTILMDGLFVKFVTDNEKLIFINNYNYNCEEKNVSQNLRFLNL